RAVVRKGAFGSVHGGFHGEARSGHRCGGVVGVGSAWSIDLRAPAPAAEAATLFPGALTVTAPSRPSRLRALVAGDPGLAVALALALVLSAGSAAYFFHAGLITAYSDAQSRLMIARTVLDGRHSGLAQLGGVWPP